MGGLKLQQRQHACLLATFVTLPKSPELNGLLLEKRVCAIGD